MALGHDFSFQTGDSGFGLLGPACPAWYFRKAHKTQNFMCTAFCDYEIFQHFATRVLSSTSKKVDRYDCDKV